MTAREPHQGLPDTTNPRGLCPRCNKQSNFIVTGSLPIAFDHSLALAERGGRGTPRGIGRVSALTCMGCKQGLAVIEEVQELPGCLGRAGRRLSWRGVH